MKCPTPPKEEKKKNETKGELLCTQLDPNRSAFDKFDIKSKSENRLTPNWPIFVFGIK